jgi:hypothetical protein
MKKTLTPSKQVIKMQPLESIDPHRFCVAPMLDWVDMLYILLLKKDIYNIAVCSGVVMA